MASKKIEIDGKRFINMSKTLKDSMIMIPLFPISSRYDNTPVVWDVNDEPICVLVIREPIDVKPEPLNEKDFKNVHEWVKAMCEKYNVINIPAIRCIEV